MPEARNVELENAFWEHESSRTVAQTRVASFLAIVCFVAYFVVDRFVSDSIRELAIIRAIVIGLLMAIIAFCSTPYARRYFRSLSVSAFYVVGFGLVALTYYTGGGVSRYHEALLLAFFGFPLLIPSRPLSAGLAFGLVSLSYDILMVATGTTGPSGIWLGNNFLLWLSASVATVGVALAYRQRRREFIAHYALAEAKAQVEKVNSELRSLDQLKSEFFANISHELRTPLTLIVSPIDELLSNLEPSPEREALLIVRRNAGRLLRMIDDLLDLAKLDAGGLRLRIRRSDVAAIARRVTENAKPACNAKQIGLSFETHGQPPEMYCDPHRLEIVFTNLIGNAVKFTPEGGRIDVRVRYSADGAAITVADTGPGISEQQIDAIFQRFHQVEGSERRQYGGVGIGLALAKELSEAHGGELTVESVWGKGATFQVFLRCGKEHFPAELIERRQGQLSEHPARRAQDRASARPAPSEMAMPKARERRQSRERVLLDRGRTARILIVEDESDLRGFMYGVLAQDFEVTAVVDGAEALKVLEEQRPDLILTDIMMPNVSGFDLCRAVKSNPLLQHIPVILLTARGESETALEGYEAGADDFVAKPFHAKVLLARIRAHLKMRALSLQIADQARLASAGTLAAGLAHEVKNPINAILSAAKVLEAGGSSKVPSEKLLGVIIDGVQRVNDVLSALDAHARPADGTDLQAVNVRDGIESTLRILEHRMKDITIHRDIDATESVRAPARAFNQVVLNLLDNAIRAGGQNVWVKSEQRGRMVCVEVADDGPGVPPDLVSRIFDPFFTTRDEGEGTGLGLHLSRRIAQDCGGEIRYDTRPGGGALFVVEVPVLLGDELATDAAE